MSQRWRLEWRPPTYSFPRLWVFYVVFFFACGYTQQKSKTAHKVRKEDRSVPVTYCVSSWKFHLFTDARNKVENYKMGIQRARTWGGLPHHSSTKRAQQSYSKYPVEKNPSFTPFQFTDGPKILTSCSWQVLKHPKPLKEQVKKYSTSFNKRTQ